MIVDLQKVLIYGSKQEIDRFFELAQRAGFMEFIGLSHKKSLELTEDIKTVLLAINIAKKHEIHPEKILPISTGPVSIAKKLVELNLMHEAALEEIRVLTLEIARIAPFGDFYADDLRFTEQEAKRIVQFFCMKHGTKTAEPLPSEVIYIGTEYDLDYFIAIHKTRTQYPKMIEIFIDRPVGELRERLEEVQERSALLEREIRSYSNALPLLQSGLLSLLNDYQLELTKHDAVGLLDGSIFAIEAWVPLHRMKALNGLLSGLDVCVEEILVEPQDKIPTCMENKGISRLGEDLVHIYDTPAHTDKDPSLWVFIFFALFFAMIVSDAGYGLLYLSIALICKWKFPSLRGAGRRFIKLAIIISSCCVVWGVASASFFGIEIGPNNPYRRISFMHFLATQKAEYHVEQKDDVYQEIVKEYPKTVNAKDGHEFLVLGAAERGGKIKYTLLETFYDNIFLELSLLLGVIHISLAFFRYLLRNWAGLGWIIFMAGGYLYFPKTLNATSLLNFTGLISKETAYAWGFQMIWYGMGLAFIGAFIQKKWGAFHEMMNVIQIFGDVLSYIRIYALALAGMMVASTFNGMGESAGLVGGVLIIIAGHGVNVILSIMGGMIHGLRLNFLEWYHYCFEGGGRLFNPLRLRK
jgi:V/A-type H+-transporting ATPase subunit I